VLSALLRNPMVTPSNVMCALEVYSDIRRPRAQYAAEMARLSSHLQSFDIPGREGMDVDLQEIEKLMEQARAWVSEGDVREDKESAMHKLNTCLLR
jgi:hypothetical protein